MSWHEGDYVSAGQKVLAFLKSKPGLVLVGFILGALCLRLYRG